MVTGVTDYLTLMSNGHTLIHSGSAVTFQAPRWAYLPMIQKAPEPAVAVSGGMSPNTESLLSIAQIPKHVIIRINAFGEACSRYAYEASERMGSAWQYFTKDKQQSSVTVEEFAQYAFYPESLPSGAVVKPTFAELYASYTFLARAGKQYKVRKVHTVRSDQEFLLRSEEEIKRIDWLLEQVRGERVQATGKGKDNKDRSTELRSFLTKARSLVEWSRASSGKDTAHSSPPEVTFSDSDYHFIDAIKEAALDDGNFSGPYKPIVMTGILRALHPLYSERPTSKDVIRFLKEIGIWTKWENLAVHHDGKKGALEHLEGHGITDWAQAVADLGEVMGQDLLATAPFPIDKSNAVGDGISQILSTNGTPISQDLLAQIKAMIISPSTTEELAFYASDPCASIRHDFKSLPVYVIDDPTAHELDDGMSIEVTDQGTWVHVHIADPTAYIPPSHPLSLTAQVRGNSAYIPERYYPMMPGVLSNERFNLGKSQFAMSFSARVDEAGRIGDFTARPSVIRNIRLVHYEDVDTILDWGSIYGVNSDRQTLSPWTANAIKDIKPGVQGETAPGLDSSDIQNLRELQTVMLGVTQGRIRNGGYSTDQADHHISLSKSVPFTPLRPTQPYLPSDDTFPQVKLKADKSGNLSPSHTMVAECMILAGRVAAQWCTDRKVPAIYRGQQNLVAYAASQGVPSALASNVLETALQQRDPVSGVIPFLASRTLIPFMPSAVVDSKPIEHFNMGIPATSNSNSELGSYCKVTSPLRRYKDMVMHWNMKAHLLGSTIPFDAAAVHQLGLRMLDSERRVSAFSNRASRFWTVEWLRSREVLARTLGTIQPIDSYIPLAPFRSDIDDRRDARAPSADAADRIVYDAYIVSVDSGRSNVRCVLPEIGGVAARLVLDKNRTPKPGEMLKVVVERLDSHNGVVVVQPR
ncbi:hypothetical protein DFS34DRAFT_582497 [Phlyctochytrium arcticum]|nr:hypothetical protein DFS34DRAFT_582497 [Phlyctochytrium arcticum]